jgi:hypothetical protein
MFLFCSSLPGSSRGFAGLALLVRCTIKAELNSTKYVIFMTYFLGLTAKTGYIALVSAVIV